MSFGKRDHALPPETFALLEQQLAEKITHILRQKYQDIPAAVKRMCQQTGIRPNTIRKWYEGRNSPSLGHVLVLMRHYPEVLKTVIELSGHAYLAAQVMPLNSLKPKASYSSKFDTNLGKNGTINVTINSEHGYLNERQRWFFAELQGTITCGAEAIVHYWNVGLRTARRDIADLKRQNLVRYVGARKTGHYVIADKFDPFS